MRAAACVLGAGLLIVGGVIFAPLWIAWYTLEPNKAIAKAGPLAILAAWGTSIVYLCREAGRDPKLDPRGPFHDCENPQCQRPIPNASRARYCSRECARITRWLAEGADYGEVPF